MKIKKLIILVFIIAILIGFNFLNSALSKPSKIKFHTDEELLVLRNNLKRSPIQAGQYFLPSKSCSGCHGFDSTHVSNVNESLEDVNLFDRWQSSMMALSAKDPFWRAKVSQEITINPAHAHELQNKCTSCHAPMGRYTALFHGIQNYSIDDLSQDSLGLDGISCGACHKISPNVGFTYSGNIPFDTSHLEYGPFVAPFVAPMQLYEGFTPTYSSHMDKAKVCSSCHTLITQSVDLTGSLTGGEFTEQATYHEYLNSSFPSNGKKCQTCHMPQLTDPIIIANGYQGLTPRIPFNQHKFAGANAFMLNLIKENRDSLGIIVKPAKFDSTIVTTLDLLKTKSIKLGLQLENITADTAYFKVKLENKVGHKFPSGYPSRRAVLQFVVMSATNDTVFQSGIFTPTYRVVGESPVFESHHNVIKQSGVPQIYEMVMGDVNNNFTSVLERAAVLLKDNRLPPNGFTTISPVYDTTLISNDALSDEDFNKLNSVEGSGIDYVHFHVPLSGFSGIVHVTTKVYYQSVPPKFVDELFQTSTFPINRFKTMYQNTDQTPVLIAKDSLMNVDISVGFNKFDIAKEIKVFPTVTLDGKVYVSVDFCGDITAIDILDSNGRVVSTTYNSIFQTSWVINLPFAKGIYYMRITTKTNVSYKKLVKL